MKVDPSGNKQWDKRFGGAGVDVLYSLEQTSEGGYILGGYSYSGADGDKSEPSRGGEDIWIIYAEADTDGDGMPDGWESKYRLNVTNALDAVQDMDRDGHANFDEYIAGTDPTNSNSRFEITDIRRTVAPPVITWSSVVNRVYGVVGSANLRNGTAWLPITNGIPGTGGSLSFTNTQPPSNHFYRVKVWRP